MQEQPNTESWSRVSLVLGRGIPADRQATNGPTEVGQGVVDAFLSGLSDQIPGFSVVEQTGFWRGERERSFRIEVLAQGSKEQGTIERILRNAGDRWKTMAKQEAYLLSIEVVDMVLIA